MVLKTLFDKNASAQLPLASLTKIITSVTALTLAPNYALVPFNNERWSIKDLLSFSLTASSNDGVSAAAAIAGSFVSHGETDAENRVWFIKEMNKKAQEIHMMNTHFENPFLMSQTYELKTFLSFKFSSMILIK